MDLKSFQKELAKQKVYDAWVYVESLRENLLYMNISYELIKSVYDNRNDKLKKQEEIIRNKAHKNGTVSVKSKDLKCTNIDIVGINIDDSIFLKKTIIEFFHYARVSMDILFQIINKALLGDKSYPIMDKTLIPDVMNKLRKKECFKELVQLLDGNKGNSCYRYLQAFDNYNKHIKTILVSIKNNFLIGDSKEFMIKKFIYNGKPYLQVDAIKKVIEINDYVIKTIDKILIEVKNQLANCLDNRSRIQKINFRQIVKGKEESNAVEYISFFIDVKENLSEIPKEIKVLPLIIKSNDKIYSFDFKFDKIFIKKENGGEESIIGCAELKNGLETNEIYRIFRVRPCTINEYDQYVISFTQKYPTGTMNYNAMEGSIFLV